MAWIAIAEAMHRQRMENQKRQQESLNPTEPDATETTSPEQQREPFDPSPYWQPEAVPPPPAIQPTPAMAGMPYTQPQIVPVQQAPKLTPEDDEDKPYT